MRAVDTNLLVRALIDSEDAQFRAARHFVATNRIYVSVTVMLESAWVLRSIFNLSRPDILATLRRIAGLPAVVVEDAAAVAMALDWADTGLDVGDALHLCRAVECDDLVTFDQPFVRAAAKLNGPRVTLLETS